VAFYAKSIIGCMERWLKFGEQMKWMLILTSSNRLLRSSQLFIVRSWRRLSSVTLASSSSPSRPHTIARLIVCSFWLTELCTAHQLDPLGLQCLNLSGGIAIWHQSLTAVSFAPSRPAASICVECRPAGQPHVFENRNFNRAELEITNERPVNCYGQGQDKQQTLI